MLNNLNAYYPYYSPKFATTYVSAINSYVAGATRTQVESSSNYNSATLPMVTAYYQCALVGAGPCGAGKKHASAAPARQQVHARRRH